MLLCDGALKGAGFRPRQIPKKLHSAGLLSFSNLCVTLLFSHVCVLLCAAVCTGNSFLQKIWHFESCEGLEPFIPRWRDAVVSQSCRVQILGRGYLGIFFKVVWGVCLDHSVRELVELDTHLNLI